MGEPLTFIKPSSIFTCRKPTRTGMNVSAPTHSSKVYSTGDSAFQSCGDSTGALKVIFFSDNPSSSAVTARGALKTAWPSAV